MSWQAASGLRGWLVQRLSAVFMVAFLFILFALSALSPDPWSYGQWRGMLATPWFNIACAAFFLSLLFHAWIGVRDVLIDYIHPQGLRFLLLVLVWLSLALMGLWVFQILIHVIRL